MSQKATETAPTRIVPMEVLVLGFCRTGTASMRAALAVLGYGNTHHIGRVMANPAEVDAWNTAIDTKFHGKGKPYGRTEWDQILGEFKAVADVPGILFAAELIQTYPDALVILTTRDPDRWWKSFSDTLMVMLGERETRLARWLDPDGFGRFVPFARRNLEILLGPLESLNEAEAKGRYLEYYDEIRKLVPRERLLEYEMGESWPKLCAFLGKDVPETPFPHKNDAKMILEGSHRQIGLIYKRAAVRVLLPTTVLVTAVLAIYLRGTMPSSTA
ncbi:P-loop containing nucleoside triphosphate hydrolase protein [Mycena capillaripes]|nr:P-loop containing nucleoside triphosphate hydrolase protein [Mycena capillaripes]